MKYSCCKGSREQSMKNTMFYREKKEVRGHELVVVDIKATGEKAQEIMKIAERATEELFTNIKEALEKEDSEESPQ